MKTRFELEFDGEWLRLQGVKLVSLHGVKPSEETDTTITIIDGSNNYRGVFYKNSKHLVLHFDKSERRE